MQLTEHFHRFRATKSFDCRIIFWSESSIKRWNCNMSIQGIPGTAPIARDDDVFKLCIWPAWSHYNMYMGMRRGRELLLQQKIMSASSPCSLEILISRLFRDVLIASGLVVSVCLSVCRSELSILYVAIKTRRNVDRQNKTTRENEASETFLVFSLFFASPKLRLYFGR